ncbi:hypothetical protein UB46_01750 [Burkholderiaceae bacterium 16]|nr:hypothetical protein UB46_01750 [Burkholderiaceae bacterium 16]
MTPYWIAIFKEALTDFYRGQHLTSFSFVYDQMVERLTGDGAARYYLAIAAWLLVPGLAYVLWQPMAAKP